MMSICACLRAADVTPPALEEIQVTAQKVTENLRDVPISITVVDAGQLEDQHIYDFGDLTRVVPNFSFSSNGNPGGSILEMRGISSAAGASPVAIYLDDVSITQRLGGGYVGQPEPELLDIQQVEVLRGPQGTLYGASAEAGVLKFRTNPVDLSSFQASGLAEGSYTQHGGGNDRINGVVNLPIVDGVFGVRLAVQHDDTSGFIDRYSPDTNARVETNINNNEATVARLTLDGHPTDRLSITAGLFYQRSLYGSSNTVTLGLSPLSTNSTVADFGSNTLIVPSLTVHFDAGWADLTSVSSDYTRNAPFQYDGTAFNSVYIGEGILNGEFGGAPVLDLAGGLSGAKIAALPAPADDAYFTRIISQELRLSSKPYKSGGSPVTWVAGLYYQQSDDKTTDNEYIPHFNEVFAANYGVPTLNALFGGPLPNELIFFGDLRYLEKQYSAFGDLTYHVIDALRVSVGLRYLSAHDTENQNAGGFFNGGDSGYAAKSKDHALTPKASVQYDTGSKGMVYATASKGFRLGGPNGPLIPFCDGDLAALGLTEGPHSYAHDSLWNYEVGTKQRPTDYIAVDFAVFYDKWDQLQQQISLPDCGSSFNTNVGSAKSYGTEFDAKVRPFEGLTLGLATGYTHATLSSAIPSMGILAGARIEGVPDWNATTSFEYQRPLLASVSGAIRANYTYTGQSHGTLNPVDPDYYRPSYNLTGGSISALFHNWEISLFAKNVFNEQKIIQTPNHADVPIGLVLQPRTVGLSVSGHL
jgi:outer membrane receptor protein involved in Fe transport